MEKTKRYLIYLKDRTSPIIIPMTQKEKFDLDTNRLQNNCHLVNSLLEIDSWRDRIKHDVDTLRRAFGIPAKYL